MKLEEAAEGLAAIVSPNRATISLKDLSLEELLDTRRGNSEYSAWLKSERMQCDADLGAIDNAITLRLEQTGSTKFEHAGFKGGYVTQKSGSASVIDAAALRKRLEGMPDVPKAEIEKALPVIIPEPIVKPDLRKVRKLAEYGTAPAEAVAAHIQEAFSRTSLVIEEIRPMLNVTPEDE
jgi:hypothetical protein